MIIIKNIPNSIPYELFLKYLKLAKSSDQDPIDALSISSFCQETNEVESRFVNLKYIISDEWIFFSNYESPKAKNFHNHNQISALIHWPKIDLQIRMKAYVKKTSPSFSDKHFSERQKEKNALAISSMQSQKIESHDQVIKDYEITLANKNLLKRPDYWGGFSFTPYYFEFWKGHKYRLNQREVFIKNDNLWENYKLQP